MQIVIWFHGPNSGWQTGFLIQLEQISRMYLIAGVTLGGLFSGLGIFSSLWSRFFDLLFDRLFDLLGLGGCQWRTVGVLGLLKLVHTFLGEVFQCLAGFGFDLLLGDPLLHFGEVYGLDLGLLGRTAILIQFSSILIHLFLGSDRPILLDLDKILLEGFVKGLEPFLDR